MHAGRAAPHGISKTSKQRQLAAVAAPTVLRHNVPVMYRSMQEQANMQATYNMMHTQLHEPLVWKRRPLAFEIRTKRNINYAFPGTV
jgi:hypothetical protein